MAQAMYALSHLGIRCTKPVGIRWVRKPEGCAGFANYAAMLGDRHRRRKLVFEISNESNSSFWKPEPDAKQYIDMVDSAVPAMRAAKPVCVIIGPSLYMSGGTTRETG